MFRLSGIRFLNYNNKAGVKRCIQLVECARSCIVSGRNGSPIKTVIYISVIEQGNLSDTAEVRFGFS